MKKLDDYKKVAEYWDEYYSNHPITIAEDRLLQKAVKKVYRQGMRVLDIGCGTGMILEQVAIHPDDYQGVDVSLSMMKEARRKFPEHEFRLDDAEELETIRASSCDFVVYGFGVFSFVDSRLALAQVERVLRKDGKFLVTFYHVGFPMNGDGGFQAAFYAHGLKPPVCEFDTVQEAKGLFKPFKRLEVRKTVTINSYLSKVEKAVPKFMRRALVPAYASLESRVLSRFSPECCHHFVLVGRKV